MVSVQRVLLYAFCVCFSCTVLASAAPTTGKRRHHAADGDAEVSIAFDSLSGDDRVLSRSRRQAARDEMTSELLGAIDADASATSAERRRRRSAVFYLTASMQFCKNYPIYCRRIEVDEGDVKIKIRLAEE